MRQRAAISKVVKRYRHHSGPERLQRRPTTPLSIIFIARIAVAHVPPHILRPAQPSSHYDCVGHFLIRARAIQCRLTRTRAIEAARRAYTRPTTLFTLRSHQIAHRRLRDLNVFPCAPLTEKQLFALECVQMQDYHVKVRLQRK